MEQRVRELERAFGPLTDPDNPTGQAALLAADARGELLPAAEQVLRESRFNDEFVPAGLGGRLDRLDALGRIVRPVFRRDASIGFAHGLHCLFAAMPVWTGGSPEQQAWLAAQLLEGRRVTVVRHKVAHGNDFTRDELAARPSSGGLVINGSKAVVANPRRAAGLVVFVRTEPDPRGRAHSVLLLDRAKLPAGCVVELPRHPTAGMRGVEFAGLQLVDCPAPDHAMIGRPGDGLELSLRSSLVIRSVIPSLLVAGVDTALRTVVRFATNNQGDDWTRIGSAHVRDTFAGVFLDLLTSDCLAVVAARAAHLLPTRVSGYAAVATYLVPTLLTEAADQLSAILGEVSYAPDGGYGMFEKQLRDLPMTAQGHSGTAGRQASLLPQLPGFAQRSWFVDAAAPDALYAIREGLPPLDLGRLAVAGDGDPVAATLVSCAEWLDRTGQRDDATAELRVRVRAFVEELGELRSGWLALAPFDRETLATPRAFALADRYALVIAAAACLGVWRAQRNGADPFLADPAWVTAALHRIGRRLGILQTRPPGGPQGRVFAEVLARFADGHSNDLFRTQLAG